MQEKDKIGKERLNLYVSQDLLKRLEYCSVKYGVSRTQLAVMLIGQGVAGIEKTFSLIENMSKDLVENLKDDNEDNK